LDSLFGINFSLDYDYHGDDYEFDSWIIEILFG
jgi:hypothetical protein